eukprot:3808943-Pleurochrysis_carterae.AAC.1
MSLADKASFEQDEWDPWEDVTVDHLNEESGVVFTAKVNASPEALLPADEPLVPFVYITRKTFMYYLRRRIGGGPKPYLS